MATKIIGDIVVISSCDPIIVDGQSALDLIMTLHYEHGVTKMVINKEAFSDDFFHLATGLAGEVTQKFVTYHFTVAIVGDFTSYTSKPLRDYMYECNHGREIFFVADKDEAVRRLNNIF